MSLSVRGRAILASGLALLVTPVMGVGAPPSDFAPPDSWWWTLEPAMFPTLIGGFLLAYIAMWTAAGLESVRVSVISSALACLSTAAGMVIAFGISDHHDVSHLAESLALVAVPGIISITALRRR